MKVYEYLAAGLPVVATPLPALAGVAEVATAADAQGVAELLDEALAEDNPRAPRSSARARPHPTRGSGGCEEIAAAIAALVKRPARHHPHPRAALRPGRAHIRPRPRAGDEAVA